MINLNKIVILSLGVVCCISNVDINAELYPHNNANNYIVEENTNNIIFIDTMANNLTNTAKQINQQFDFYNKINIAIKSFIENNKSIEENSINKKIAYNSIKDSIDFTNALSNIYHINIEIPLQNLRTTHSIYEELYNNHFKNAILNNNTNRIEQILTMSSARATLKENEIQIIIKK